MSIKQRIERYMIDMDLSFEEVEEDTWIIDDDINHIDNIVVRLADPIVLFRVKVMPIPRENREKFYERLLDLNTTDMTHGAYGVENDSIVIIDTLQAENLDLNEFQSTIESIGLALTSHYEELVKYID